MAAKYLGGSAWELNNLEEPDRTFWITRGVAYQIAEQEALATNRKMNKQGS